MDSDLLIKGAKQLRKDRLKGDVDGPRGKRKKRVKPRLSEYISKETMIQLYENAMDIMEPDNNVKADNIVKIMGPEYQELGTGTNRIALMRDGYVFKIALDRRGIIDNLAEYKRAAEAPEYLAKCYETNRVVAISEYVNLISLEEYKENKDKIHRILAILTSRYVIKDLGLTPKNYCNWGYRDDDTIVALDYAYMYPLAGSPNALKCSCGGTIQLDNTFTIYKCNNGACGLTYTAMEILNKMDFDAERIDDAAVMTEAGLDMSAADYNYGEQYVNFVKMTGPTDNDIKIDDEEEEELPPLNTSSLADIIKNYVLSSEEDDNGIYVPSKEPVKTIEFLDALDELKRKKAEE